MIVDNNFLSFVFGTFTFIALLLGVCLGNVSITFLLSLIITSIWLVWLRYEVKLFRKGTPVQAEVVELIPSGSSSKPRVVFMNQDQQEISYIPRWALPFPGVRVGDRVPVIYQPENPNKAIILKFRYSFCISWGFTCAGISAALFCGGVMYGSHWLEGIARSAGF